MNLSFSVLHSRRSVPVSARPGLYLVPDNWNDYSYVTTYHLYYVPEKGTQIDIGDVKIGRKGMQKGTEGLIMLTEFVKLDDSHFSLGQDVSYYRKLTELDSRVSETITKGLRDVAADEQLWEEVAGESVMVNSLLRFVTVKTVEDQFRRVLRGEPELTDFHFTFLPAIPESETPVELSFQVHAGSTPPTNIHVLIGSNGSGKTRMLQHLACVLTDLTPAEPGFTRPTIVTYNESGKLFASLVSVTFSAFDPFNPLPELDPEISGLPYTYIGLKKKGKDGVITHTPKDHLALQNDFVESVKACRQGARAERWKRALTTLESDPIFSALAVSNLAGAVNENQFGNVGEFFSSLSSGHKIVLLTLTRLVETVTEKTLVLLDEPEAHLHPPLLSSFVRAISELLLERNGVAIVATHSPVILQEVPKNCVWKIVREGQSLQVSRLERETFGENISDLTSDVFGLEITQAGFHRLIADLAKNTYSYEEMLAKFSHQLGGDARALVRTVLAHKEQHPPQQ